MSESLTRKETWQVRIRPLDSEPSEESVLFLQYDSTLDASLIEEDADEATYIVALFDRVSVVGSDEVITGILVSRFPDDAEDPKYLALCEALTGGPLPTVFGERYDGYTLEQLRDDIEAYADQA